MPSSRLDALVAVEEVVDNLTTARFGRGECVCNKCADFSAKLVELVGLEGAALHLRLIASMLRVVHQFLEGCNPENGLHEHAEIASDNFDQLLALSYMVESACVVHTRSRLCSAHTVKVV